MPSTHIRRYTSLSAVIDMLMRREIALLDPHLWDDRNDTYFMDLYKSYKGVSGLYGMCCTQAAETYHHWRVFSGGAHGACIKLKRKPFEASLLQMPETRTGEVTYVLLDELDKLGPQDRENLPFLKRFGYGPEKEYRVIATSREPQQKLIKIPLDLAHIETIHLNPWMSVEVFDSVSMLLKGIPGCERIRLSRSSLTDNERWKQAGDRIAAAQTDPR